MAPTFYSLREYAGFEGCNFFFLFVILSSGGIYDEFQSFFTCQTFLRKLYCICEHVWCQNLDARKVPDLNWQFYSIKDKCLFDPLPISDFRSINFLLVSDGPARADALFVVLWIHAYRSYGCIPHVLVLMNECLNGLAVAAAVSTV